MIIQSTRITTASGSKRLARHLLDKPAENERITILQGDRAALDDAQALAKMKGCKYGIRHLSISPQKEMSPEQLRKFLQSIDQEFKIGPHRPKLIVLHRKAGRTHFHIAIGEVDPQTLKVLDCKKDFNRLEKLARVYEQENDEMVQPSRRERQQQGVQGVSQRARKRAERVAPDFDRTALRKSKSVEPGQLFEELDRQGLRLVQGNKEPILISKTGKFVASANRSFGIRKDEEFKFYKSLTNTIEYLKYKITFIIDNNRFKISNNVVVSNKLQNKIIKR